MTVISKGAVLKKKVDNDVYIYQPYTHIDYVEGGLDQTEIENLINSAGYLDTSAVNAILESYYTKSEVNNLLSYSGGDYITSGNVLNVIEQVDSLFGDMDSVIGDGSFGSNPNYIQKGTTITQAMVALDTQAKVNADGIQSINTNKANKATTLSGYGITNAYTKTEVDNKVTTLNNSITTTVNTHNSNTSAHSDIRNLISDLANRLNALANSDDTTLDQMAEVVSYIKSNRGLIEGITTTKANKDYVDTELAKKANSANLAKVATSGSYNDLSNKPTIPTTLPANGGNADTVGGFTVGTNVPATAKFTDTTYSSMTATEATTGTATTARSISAKVLNDKINAVVTANSYSHPNSGVTEGTYRSVTVNAQGHIISGSNPTVTIAQGGTNATTVEKARENLEVSVKTYTTYQQIGLSSSPKTLLELVQAVPTHSVFMREVSSSYETLGLPFMGLLIINKGNYGNVSMWNYRQGGANIVHHKVAFCNWSNGQTEFKWGEIPCLEDGVLQIENGGTGATTSAGVLINLGITATATELNYCDGVTSNIQTQLNNKLSTTGTASKATADGNGNNIVDTYAKKSDVYTKAEVNSLIASLASNAMWRGNAPS